MLAVAARGPAACPPCTSTSYAQPAANGVMAVPLLRPCRLPPSCTAFGGCSSVQPLPAGDAAAAAAGRRPRAVCRSQVRYFNTQFDPSKSSVPQEYQFGELVLRNPYAGSPAVAEGDPPLAATSVNDAGVVTVNTPGPVGDAFWDPNAPKGSFTVGSSYARRVRLTPMRLPGEPLRPLSAADEFYT